MPQQPMIYYAVTQGRGEHWDARRSMREQEQWDEHARFMDALVDDGFIVLGGPLDDGEKVLLIFNAESRQAIEARLAGDPWMPMGIRRIAQVERWEILLTQKRAEESV
ncbi:MAG: YciI family protein [Chloroflexota bacterium]|nr:YciI family protein [Chloroflexota bacterium]